MHLKKRHGTVFMPFRSFRAPV